MLEAVLTVIDPETHQEFVVSVRLRFPTLRREINRGRALPVRQLKTA